MIVLLRLDSAAGLSYSGLVIVGFGLGVGVCAVPVFMLSETFSLSRSISSTLTLTCCQSDTTSIGCPTKRSAICDLCTRPSLCNPISTNAQKSVMFLTIPSNCIPIWRSLISIISAANDGGVRSSLGSCPGRWSSLITSIRVSCPISYFSDRCAMDGLDIVSGSVTFFLGIWNSHSIKA